MRPALDACTARANDLMALSRERIADELLKLLALSAIPRRRLELCSSAAILRPVLPEIEPEAPCDLEALIASEGAAAVARTRCAD